MQDTKILTAIFVGVAGLAAALVAGVIIVAPQPVMATPAIAQKTGHPCTTCHTTPPKLNAYGRKYKAGTKH